jgi:hypothetical protein
MADPRAPGIDFECQIDMEWVKAYWRNLDEICGAEEPSATQAETKLFSAIAGLINAHIRENGCNSEFMWDHCHMLMGDLWRSLQNSHKARWPEWYNRPTPYLQDLFNEFRAGPAPKAE